MVKSSPEVVQQPPHCRRVKMFACFRADNFGNPSVARRAGMSLYLRHGPRPVVQPQVGRDHGRDLCRDRGYGLRMAEVKPHPWSDMADY